MPDYNDLITKHAQRVGIDPAWMRKIMRIESGGDPRNTTGSYKGLFQLSGREFRAHGGSGDIYDPEQNTMAAANKLAKEKLWFKEKFGRDPTLNDLYMIHQQGQGGVTAHLQNPDQPAWKSMLSTAEGKQKGEKWAKSAIWGNVPDDLKAKYGSVDNITSKQFYSEIWGGKTGDTKFEGYGPLKVAKKDKSAEEEGWKGTKRGTFLGEQEDKKMDTDFGFDAPGPMSDIQLPSVASADMGGIMRGPRVPGATRWESG